MIDGIDMISYKQNRGMMTKENKGVTSAVPLLHG